MFHAHRCCKLPCCFLKPTWKITLAQPSCYFSEGMIHHKHPSTIPWLAPAVGSCTIDAWTSGSWHQACANVIAKAGNDDPLANQLPELPIFGEEWRKYQIPGISSSEIFWFHTWSSKDPSSDSGWLYTYVIWCIYKYMYDSIRLQITSSWGWTSVVANQENNERLPPHLAIEEHPTLWQQIRTRCTHGSWVEDVTSAVGPFGARVGFVPRNLNIGIFQKCLSRNRTLQREEVQSPRSLAWMLCGGSQVLNDSKCQQETRTRWSLRMKLTTTIHTDVISFKCSSWQAHHFVPMLESKNLSHFDCVKSSRFPRFHQGTVLALKVLVKLTLTSNSPILILRFSREFGWSWAPSGLLMAWVRSLTENMGNKTKVGL